MQMAKKYVFGLLLALSVVPVGCAQQKETNEQRLFRRERAAYRYVHDILSPPQTAVTEEFYSNPLVDKIKLWGRIGGVALSSVVLSKGLIKIILMLPIIGDAVGTLDDRITLCTNLVQCGQTLVRAQQNLRDVLVQRGRPADAASLMNHRLPNYEPDLFAMITQKTALDNVLSTLEKGVAAIIFLVLCHRFFRQSEPTADWTYFGILEKVVLAWPEHRFHFPQTLRPLFETLYNVHIACHNVFDITEEDAKNIVESVSLEAIHNLDLRYFG